MTYRPNRTPLPLVSVSALFIGIWLFLAAFPFLWTLWGSMKVENDFFSYGGWTDAITGRHTIAQTGGMFTFRAYRDVWLEEQFWKPAVHTMVVSVLVVLVSLICGTLGGYALARSNSRYSFWLLIAALIFRSIPGITLISGYLQPFFELNIWGYISTAVIVMVALNQPFALWLLHAFFLSIPRELDESALVDGCSRFQAFYLVIMPVMWPGVVTTGIFCFLGAYSDFVICGLLLSERNQTMVPRIVSFLGTTQQTGRPMLAVAAVVSVTLPLFFLVMLFQRRLIGGLAGAIKG